MAAKPNPLATIAPIAAPPTRRGPQAKRLPDDYLNAVVAALDAIEADDTTTVINVTGTDVYTDKKKARLRGDLVKRELGGKDRAVTVRLFQTDAGEGNPWTVGVKMAPPKDHDAS